MKDDCLAPPTALNMPKRRKPHTLPPLEKFRNLEGRGSPIPQVRRRSSIEEQLLQEDGQVTPADGQHPLIRLTKCPEEALAQGAGGAGGAEPGKRPHGPHGTASSRYIPLQPIRKGKASEENGNSI